MSGFLQSLSDNITVDKDKCVFCGKCADTCILDNIRLKLSPCRAACPMGVNIQGYVQLILRGEKDKARAVIREKLPFPEVMCMVCHHPCEAACERGKSDAPVGIRALKRHLFDCPEGQQAFVPEKAPGSGKRVAVVGAGPAGLVAAYDLALKGHAVTVFDAAAQPGGLLRNGIPAFRLPETLLSRELGVLSKLGVDMVSNHRVGRDSTLTTLMKDFQAVVLAPGLSAGRSLGVEGEKLTNVMDGMTLLRGVRTGTGASLSGHVVVIGGGNVAVDTAMTALRQGASRVTMVALESEAALPAFPQELEQARAEGIVFHCGWGVERIQERKGQVGAVELKRCTSVLNDQGAFAPAYDSTDTMTLDADYVLVAIGLRPDPEVLTGSDMALKALAEAHPLTRQCAGLSLFVAGDVSRGPSSVISAMADGRAAAESAHRLLLGEHLAFGRSYAGPVETDFAITTERGTEVTRQNPSRHVCTGKGDYGLVEGRLSDAQASEEASRCYSCGGPFGKHRTCWFCLPCEVDCPEKALYVKIPYLLR